MTAYTVKTKKNIFKMNVETTNKTPNSTTGPASTGQTSTGQTSAGPASAGPASAGPVQLSENETTAINEFAKKFVTENSIIPAESWLRQRSVEDFAKTAIEKLIKMMKPIFRKTDLHSNIKTIKEINKGRIQEIKQKEVEILGTYFNLFMELMENLEKDLKIFNEEKAKKKEKKAKKKEKKEKKAKLTQYREELKNSLEKLKEYKEEIKLVVKLLKNGGGAKHKKTKRRTKRMRKSMRKTKRRHKSKKRRKR